MRATQPISQRHGSSNAVLTTALSLPVSQYYCVTMAAISGIYSKRKLQHRSLVKVQPLQLQLGF